MLNRSWQDIIMLIPVLLISLTIHEFAHALAAMKLGDDTPKEQGRLTLNPLKHIDPVGFLLLVAVGFGWAKPVVINKDKLKKPVLDDILISLAGPFSNLLLAIIGTLAFGGLIRLYQYETQTILEQILIFLHFFILMNAALFVFNMLPIPPLDGSHLYTSFLTQWKPALAIKIFRYGSLALIGIIALERFTGRDILPIGQLITAVVSALFRIIGLQY